MSDAGADRRASPLANHPPHSPYGSAEPPAGRAGADEGSRGDHRSDQSLRALAHELNSLLDGGLRTLRMTRRALSLGEPTPQTVSATNELDDVEVAMVRMTDVLHRVLSAPPPSRDVAPLSDALRIDRPLGATLEAVLQGLSPLAHASGVSIRVECEPTANGLSTGPLEPLLRNTIRNAIEAFPVGWPSPTVSVAMRCRGPRLEVDVLDNGPGIGAPNSPAKSASGSGAGLGLHVAREVVGSLGGALDLRNVPFGPGAIVRAHVPLTSLTASRAA